MTIRRLLGAVAFVVSAASSGLAQKPGVTSGCSPSAAELRAMTTKARSEQANDNDFIRALDAAVGLDTAALVAHPAIIVVSNDSLNVMVLLPYSTYRFGLMEALRKKEPIADVPIPPGVVVAVSPSRIDAPDIFKVVVERNGHEIAPLDNRLKPTELTTRVGAKAVLHAGELLYPCSAFATGASMRVTAIPQQGSNLVKEIDSSDLAIYSRGDQKNLALSLVGLKDAEVIERIGKPTTVDGFRWTYRKDGDALRLYLNENNIVTTVEPRTFDLSRIAGKQ